MAAALLALYALTLAGLVFFAVHRLKILWLYARYCRAEAPPRRLQAGGLFLNFNGTSGIGRRAALENAGGSGSGGSWAWRPRRW